MLLVGEPVLGMEEWQSGLTKTRGKEWAEQASIYLLKREFPISNRS